MSFKTKLDKILSIKEKEKDEVISEYNDSVKSFESVANKLYELLKQKEELAEFLTEKVLTGFHVQQIQQYQRYILKLDKTINDKQGEVSQAREVMNNKEEKMIEKNIEVKKYEKIKEKKIEALKLFEKAEESKLMDEISIQQYMNRGN